MRIHIFLLLMLVCLKAHSITDTGVFFKRYNTTNKLTSNRITAITQDNDGRIWIGTDYGINCLSGNTITNINPNPYTILPNYISSLLSINDSCLIAGTEKGLFFIDTHLRKIIPFEYQTKNGTKIDSYINNTIIDYNSNIWISTLGQGIFKFNAITHKLEQYNFENSRNIINHLVKDENNNIWAGDFCCIYKYSVNDNKFIKSGYDADIHTTFLYSDRNYIWIGTWRNGLFRINIESGKLENFLGPNSSEHIYNIHSILKYKDNLLFLGTDDGLITFNTETFKTTKTQINIYNNFAVSDKFIYEIFKDKEGGVWFGTYYNGINYLSPYNDLFKKYSKYNSINLNGNIIGKFCEDINGNIWIGSDDNGVSLFFPKSNSFSTFPEKHNLTGLNVQSLMSDSVYVWIGTYGDGIIKINCMNGQKCHYQNSGKDSTTIDNKSVYSIHKDCSGNIWIGTMSGICRYNREKDNFSRLMHTSETIHDIEEDNKFLWFCSTGKELIRFDKEENKWKTFVLKNISSYCNCISINDSISLWLGTPNGLYLFNQNTEETVLIDNNRLNKNIKSIMSIGDILWITTDSGLMKLNKKSHEIDLFTSDYGLQSENFNTGSILKDSNGLIYIGSNNGFNVFNPKELCKTKKTAKISLIDLIVNNHKIAINDKDGILKKDLDNTETLYLNYNENIFSIIFSELTYSVTDIKYAYMLQGFDKEWNYAETNNKATYTNISPGKYIFKVRTYDENNKLNNNEASINIVIRPPFYLSIPFKILYIAIFFGFIAAVIMVILKRKEKKHNIEIEKINQNKEKEIQEAKINFFTTIAHEIRTPVSLIIGPIEKVMQERRDMDTELKKDLQVIDRNSQRLLCLVNQLLDFRKVEQKDLHLNMSRENISAIVSDVCDRFIPTLNQKGIRLNINIPAGPVMCDIDKEAFTKVISNLFTNANKYTRDLISVSVEENKSAQSVTIRVTDNGIGIKKEETDKIFKPFYQSAENKPGTGIGLSIVDKIVKAHKGSVKVESEYNNGASFIINIPTAQAQYRETDLPADIIPEDIVPETKEQSVGNKLPFILIADDNEDMTSFLEDSLKGKFNIITANNGKQALDILHEQEISLIVSDWMMPEMNGIELCKAVRDDIVISHIPFILLTAKTDNVSKTDGMNCGVDAYIEKPFSIRYLEACINNLLDIRFQLRNKFSKMPMAPVSSIASNSNDEILLNRMTKIIEDNMTNPDLSVDFIAKELGISRSGMYTKIKGLANVTPNEMVQIIRLKKAAELILSNKYRINEICYMVGFNDTSYFAKCFQKQFGIKPNEYMEANKK